MQRFLGSFVQDCGSTRKRQNATMILRMLKGYFMEDCKPVSTPLFQGLDLAVDKSNDLLDETLNRELFGSLLHSANTVRPDIAFALDYLSRFMHMRTKML